MTAAVVCCVLVPIRIESVANLREHWSERAKRAREHKTAVWYSLRAARAPHSLPCIVTLTRIAPRALDGDNLQSGLKAARDGVALWLQVDDADERITWRYRQRKGKPLEYAAEVVIECEA
jgi:hypothetical protein